MAIVTAAELGTYLQHTVSTTSAEQAVRVAEGWLRSVCTSLTTWPPNPVPEDLWAWTLELAALSYGNPVSLVTRSTDEETRNWSMERRREILDAARFRYGGAAAPEGSANFREPLDWPDPIQIYEPVTE